MDKILEPFGLTFDELTEDEQKTYTQWLGNLKKNEVTLDDVKSYITSLRESVETEITAMQETSGSWLSFLPMLIPLIGIVRKWYADQKKVYLEARLRNLILIEAFVYRQERAEHALEKLIATVKPVK